MDNPVLKNNEYAVWQAEYSTGIILKKDGTYYNDNESISDVYEIFDSLEGAKTFALNTVQENPKIESLIIDSLGNCVFVYDKEGKREHN